MSETENDEPARDDGLETLYTITDLSLYLKVSTSTIYRMINDGALRGSRIGRSLRFTKKNIEDMLDYCKVNKNDF